MCFSIYFCAIYRSEDEEEFQEDSEDPDFVEEQEEDLAEGKSYLSLIILNPRLQTHPIEPVLNTYIACLFRNTV